MSRSPLAELNDGVVSSPLGSPDGTLPQTILAEIGTSCAAPPPEKLMLSMPDSVLQHLKNSSCFAKLSDDEAKNKWGKEMMTRRARRAAEKSSLLQSHHHVRESSLPQLHLQPRLFLDSTAA
eukprot:3059816-Amphidinium_carterae.1